MKAQRSQKNQRQISFSLTFFIFFLNQLLSLCVLNRSLHWLLQFRVKCKFLSTALSCFIKYPYQSSQPHLFLSIIVFEYLASYPNYLCPDSQQAPSLLSSCFGFNILSAHDTFCFFLVHPNPIPLSSSLSTATHPGSLFNFLLSYPYSHPGSDGLPFRNIFTQSTSPALWQTEHYIVLDSYICMYHYLLIGNIFKTHASFKTRISKAFHNPPYLI